MLIIPAVLLRKIGGSLGVMNCLTDLGGGKGLGKKFVKDVNIGSTEPEGSVYYSVIYKNAIALRTEAAWGVAKASDAAQKSFKETTGGRYERNLSFRSSIFEISLVTEIHPRFLKIIRSTINSLAFLLTCLAV
ncbi:MAG: hypothetical protein WDM90_16605 [Ferruginibacter sp.]